MIAPDDQVSPGASRWLTRRIRLACFACVAVFLWAIAKFYDPDTGFSSLIQMGDLISAREVTALKNIPHYVYEKSPGYDGAYYVQLAMYPTLDDPELAKSIDNLPYRSRRMLFAWVAWALGLGKPAWILQTFSLLNVVCWVALAWVLLWWFPPTNLENFFRWCAVLFSHGLCMSVRDSLVDGPTLLLIALAMRWYEQGRKGASAVTMALVGLGRESSLISVAGILDFDWRRPRTWLRPAGMVVLIALPILAWIGYVRWKFGPVDDPGLGNFTLPLAGLAEKWGVSLAALLLRTGSPLKWATLAAVFALTVQFLFFVVRWRPQEAWWRVGAVFAGMMVFLSTPVWEGSPGAAARVLLPMTLAFNIMVPRGRRWLALLIAGNLTVVSGYKEFTPPSHEFFRIEGDSEVTAAVRGHALEGWYAPESTNGSDWRWSSGEAQLRLRNYSAGELSVVLHGRIAGSTPGHVRLFAGDRMVWAGDATDKLAPLQAGFTIPEGDTILRFVSDQPGHPVGTDLRSLSFKVLDLKIAVTPFAGRSP